GPDHVLGHLLVVLEPGKVCDRPPRPAGALAGPGTAARHGTAFLVRDLRGPGDRRRHRGAAALFPGLLREYAPAPGRGRDPAAGARDLRRLQRRAERVPGPGPATRAAAPAEAGAGRVPAPGHESPGFRDRDVSRHRNPKEPPVRLRPD